MVLYTKTNVNTSLNFKSTSSPTNNTSFGGYGSQAAQNQALANAIRKSRAENPEYFKDKSGKEYTYVQQTLNRAQPSQPKIAAPKPFDFSPQLAYADNIPDFQGPIQPVKSIPSITGGSIDVSDSKVIPPSQRSNLSVAANAPYAGVQQPQQQRPLPQQQRPLPQQPQQSYNQYSGNVGGQIQDAVLGTVSEVGQGVRNIGEDYLNIANLDYKDKSLINQSIGRVFEGDFEGAGQVITSNPPRLVGELLVEAPLTLIPMGPILKGGKAAVTAGKNVIKQLITDPIFLRSASVAEKGEIEKIADKWLLKNKKPTKKDVNKVNDAIKQYKEVRAEYDITKVDPSTIPGIKDVDKIDYLARQQNFIDGPPTKKGKNVFNQKALVGGQKALTGKTISDAEAAERLVREVEVGKLADPKQAEFYNKKITNFVKAEDSKIQKGFNVDIKGKSEFDNLVNTFGGFTQSTPLTKAQENQKVISSLIDIANSDKTSKTNKLNALKVLEKMAKNGWVSRDDFRLQDKKFKGVVAAAGGAGALGATQANAEFGGFSLFPSVPEADAAPVGPVVKKFGNELVDFGKLLFATAKGEDVGEYYAKQNLEELRKSNKYIADILPPASETIQPSNVRTMQKIKATGVTKGGGLRDDKYPSKSLKKNQQELLKEDYKGNLDYGADTYGYDVLGVDDYLPLEVGGPKKPLPAFNKFTERVNKQQIKNIGVNVPEPQIERTGIMKAKESIQNIKNTYNNLPDTELEKAIQEDRLIGIYGQMNAQTKQQIKNEKISIVAKKLGLSEKQVRDAVNNKQITKKQLNKFDKRYAGVVAPTGTLGGLFASGQDGGIFGGIGLPSAFADSPDPNSDPNKFNPPGQTGYGYNKNNKQPSMFGTLDYMFGNQQAFAEVGGNTNNTKTNNKKPQQRDLLAEQNAKILDYNIYTGAPLAGEALMQNSIINPNQIKGNTKVVNTGNKTGKYAVTRPNGKVAYFKTEASAQKFIERTYGKQNTQKFNKYGQRDLFAEQASVYQNQLGYIPATKQNNQKTIKPIGQKEFNKQQQQKNSSYNKTTKTITNPSPGITKTSSNTIQNPYANLGNYANPFFSLGLPSKTKK